jgi:hypothetical protein
MKKMYVIGLLILVSLLSGCTTYEHVITDTAFNYGYSNYYNEAFVGEYRWDGTEAGMHLSIPDAYDTYPITSLGGYFGSGVPTPFRIKFPDSYGVTGMTSIEPEEYPRYYENGYEIITLTFYVSLGIYLKEAKNVMFEYYRSENEDLSITLYQVYYYFEVDSNNPYIYAKDGKLYSIETDELLEGLSYL